MIFFFLTTRYKLKGYLTEKIYGWIMLKPLLRMKIKFL